MVTYNTPGVYVEEISTLPPSVAEVATAVPAFIGYTSEGAGTVARIDSLLEYTQHFGEPAPTTYHGMATVDPQTGQTVLNGDLEQDTDSGEAGRPGFLMYYCLSHYFNNGGGSCYVISVSDPANPKKSAADFSAEDFSNGLKKLEREDEPTLILLTDAVNLPVDDYYEVCKEALTLCSKLGDRFAILDVKDDAAVKDAVETFRDKIGVENLKYGAAYHPYLETSLVHHHDVEKVEINMSAASPWKHEFEAVEVTYKGDGTKPQVKIVKGGKAPTTFEVDGDQLTVRNVDGVTAKQLESAWEEWAADHSAGGFTVAATKGEGAVEHTDGAKELKQATGDTSVTLGSMADEGTVLVSQVKAALAAKRVTLPPSAAMAGIYARVDRERGVWKAPANVGLAATIGPVAKITHDEQGDLNEDSGGKSINAIRAFAGKGTLVWGARTLAGNSLEWRYVPVRRLFNMIEESTRKASSFAVFEPNDANTWLKVKGMIDSFLYGLWERGALAGPTPESAYVVNVGLGKTMTPDDIDKGLMIVEIGVAAVRPAEFIMLRFSHKTQEA